MKLKVWLLLLLPFGALAQTYKRPEIDLEAFVLNLFNSQDEDVNYDDLYESLFQFYREPLNLNQAKREDLANLYILTEGQINALLEHIKKTGRLLSVYELQAIEGFDHSTIQKLLPFVTVADDAMASDARSLWQRMRTEDNHYLILRWDRVLAQKKGYTNTITDGISPAAQRYVGSPDRFYARYRLAHTNDFSFGFTAEKDAGENVIFDASTRRYGADFYSFHAAVFNKGRFKTILIGDYVLQIGQGVLLSGGFAVGKGAETTATIRRTTKGILPYTSVLESGFFRGVAATYQLSNRLRFTGFVSSIRQDANIFQAIDSLDQSEDVTNYIQRTGLHRTPNELKAKNTLPEQNLGGYLQYISPERRFSAGVSVLQTNFGVLLSPSPKDYNQFEFSGKQNFALGLDYSYYWQNFSFFGEAARSSSGGIGGVNGVIASLSSKVEAALLLRHFDRNFHSFYGNALNENTRNINETGLYWGIKVIPNRKWQLAAYYDIFYFPWLKFRVDAPTQGDEMLLRLTHKPSKKVSLFIQYRQENKPRNLPSGGNAILAPPINTSRENWIFYGEYSDNYFSVKSRVLLSSFTQTQIRTGFAAAQDVSYEVGRFDFSMRMAIFDTDDFDTRIYIYERDVLYSFTIPPYFGQGMRSYLMVQFKPTRKISIWARYAVWSYRNQETIGSGLEEIRGRTRPDFRLQMMVKF